jgi:hypothetical protein
MDSDAGQTFAVRTDEPEGLLAELHRNLRHLRSSARLTIQALAETKPVLLSAETPTTPSQSPLSNKHKCIAMGEGKFAAEARCD